MRGGGGNIFVAENMKQLLLQLFVLHVVYDFFWFYGDVNLLF